MTASGSDIDHLLNRLEKGDPGATSQLIPLVYDELRRRAAQYLRRESPGHSLQATALVHEAYLRLVEQRDVAWKCRAHFLGIAAKMMRRILVDHARKHFAAKRKGSRDRITFDETAWISKTPSDDMIPLDEALHRLEQLDPQQSRIVEMKFFGGLSAEQISEALGISTRTVKRDWSVARAWLHRELAKGRT
ncbi:MAG: sigma-70 family RNA polymerase sigma factor [Bryobacteraceae bacterium]